MSQNNPIQLTKEELSELVKESVQQTFTMLGIKFEDPTEMQADFHHLRQWRQAVETIKQKSLLTLAGIIITGFFGFVWLGIKSALKG